MTDRPTHRVFQSRRAGVLLHPTSLPRMATEGALGEEAFCFIDFLADAGFSVWQILPLNPTDGYYSPYQTSSVHAGNPRLISPRQLLAKAWLSPHLRASIQEDSTPRIALMASLRKNFLENATGSEHTDYQRFLQQHSYWLDDYSLYSVIRLETGGKPWWEWPAGLRNRDKADLDKFQQQLSDSLQDYCFEQYVFFDQWQTLRKRAHERGIVLFGDMPILAAHDSVDVWRHPEYFQLDNAGQPLVVAGVPPDYFSATGQRWGNPLYCWSSHQADGFQWWIDRFRTQLELFDLIRLDHFRGYDSLWEIPATHQTAEGGSWQPVPGRELFRTLQDTFGELPLVAEDLGIIPPKVIKLRDDLNFPGMKILQFAFDSNADNPYLPHNHDLRSLVYTGTHDNDTTLGWYTGLSPSQQQRVLEYLRYPEEPIPWPLINSALQSVCPLAILPMQDLLELDSSHRMNTPGTITGNWQWQFDWSQIPDGLAGKLRQLNRLYGRC